MARVPLHLMAHGRTGDKGDRSNISVIAYRPEAFPFIVEQLTEARVAEAFRHRRPTAVKRYVLPKLHAMNFVLRNALGGGGTTSLHVDAQGKTMAQGLLNLEVDVSSELLGNP